ncbi:MAG: DinB family protein [Planctomycetota bacterium]
MDAKILIEKLNTTQEFFERSTSALAEADSNFAPAPGLFSAAATVMHVALTVDWFVEGAFERADGFSMDFEALDKDARGCTSLAAARAKLKAAFDHARAVIGDQSPATLEQPLPHGPVMGGEPRFAIVSGIDDHTAHHRGALTVYARLCGHVPPMPYMDPM